MGVVFVICGVAGIVVAIFGKEFERADIISLTPFRIRQPISGRSGRLIFASAGVALLAVGIRMLVGGEQR